MHPSQVFDTYLGLIETLSAPGAQLPWYMDEIALNSRRAVGDVGMRTLHHLRAGYVFQVDAKIMGLVEQRSKELPSTVRITQCPPPTPCGFMSFEEPYRFRDVAGRDQAVSHVSWGGARFNLANMSGLPRTGNPLFRQEAEINLSSIHEVGGYVITLWNDHRLAPDDFSRKILDSPEVGTTARRDLGLVLPLEILPVMNNYRAGPDVVWPTDEDYRRLRERGETAQPHVNVLRRLLAVWSLMDESIADHREDTGFRRSARRRADRLQAPSRVTVVSLRRYSGDTRTGTGTPLDHRIWVRPHKRTYWVGSGPDRKKIERNIDGHFRGPDGTPLVVTDKVYRLHR